MQQTSLQFDKNDREALTQQELAADPEFNVFVSASAGTGKTKVLCDRFINLVLNGTKPENVLCVTYTNSAAEEMRERIISQISKLCTFSDYDLNTYFRSLNKHITQSDIKSAYESIMSALSSLRIQTLHAFCMQILKANRISGKNLEFSIMSGYQQSTLCKNIYNNLLSYAATTGFEDLQASFEVLFQYFSFNEVRNRIISSIHDAQEIELHLNNLTSDFIFDLHSAHQNYDSGAEFSLLLGDISPSLKAIIDSEAELIELTHSIETCNLPSYSKFFLTTENKPRAKLIKKALSLKHPELEMLLNHESTKLCKLLDDEKNYASAHVNWAFAVITKQFLSDYKEAKSSKNLLNYGDLIPMTLDLLNEDQSLLYNLDYRIDHILVDEAQDLSKDQWALVKALSLEFFSGFGAREINRTIFIVGDFKQSIFSFQGARPELFLEALEYFEAHSQSALKQWRYIEFDLSYRSTNYVLALVNEVFKERFDGYKLHAPFKSGDGKIEVWDLKSKPPKEKTDIWEMPSSEPNEDDHKRILARSITSRITKWIQNKRLVSDTMDVIKPSDIMILVRKRSEFVDILASEIRKAGFNVDSIGSKFLIDDLIYKDLLSLIHFHIYPSDDLNLAGLLKSPFFRSSEVDLFDLCATRSGSLISSIKELNNEIYSKLTKLRSILTSHTPFDAFCKIFLECGYQEEFIKSFGSKAIEKLEYFLSVIQKYETESQYYNWKECLEYLSIEDDKSSEASEDSIKIMTTHSAKGLQAPIVILADAASSRNNQYDKILMNDKGLHFMLSSEHASSYLKQAAESLKQAEEAESIRLLYVALTRAERELYIAGLSNNKEKGSWYDIISNHYKDIWNSQDVYTDKTEQEIQNKKEKHNISWVRSLVCDISKESLENSFDNKALRYGELVHDILHKKCVLTSHHFEEYINSLYSKSSFLFQKEDIDSAMNESLYAVNAHPSIFNNEEAKSEIPLSAYIDGSLKHFRIDRIILDQDFIKIIDFKTDRQADASVLRQKHVAQVKLYATILESLYCDKLVETYLLWTKNALLEKV